MRWSLRMSALAALSSAGMLMVGHQTQASPPKVPHLLGKPNPMRSPTAFSQAFRAPLQVSLRTRFLKAQRKNAHPNPLALPLWIFFQLHRVGFSALNADQSDVAPVHSLYALEATQRHGFFWGSLLTTSRLLHEVDLELQIPKLQEKGRVYRYDPLKANTYWLFRNPP